MRNKIRLIYTAAIQFAIMIAAAQAIDAQVYGGRAIGIAASTTTNGTTTNYVSTDTGQLPATGGDVNTNAPSYAIPGLLETGVLTASTSGALRSSQSFAVVNDFITIINGVTVRADRITVRTNCICCPGADLGTCVGSTEVTNLTVNGTAVNLSRDGAGNLTTNQQFALPNGVGTLYINEQAGGNGEINVNGLRIAASANGTAYSVTAANARSALDCLTTSPTAGPATVSGRVLNRNGQGISGARVTLTDQNGNARSAITNSLGNFAIADVPSGETYILTVSHRMYSFSPQALGVNDDMTVNVTAN